MQLLVSVTGADEAICALRGGAEIIDAKDPSAGALGAVDPETFSAIRAVVDREAIVSAALGDATSASDVERAAEEMAGRGATFVKIGFARVADFARVAELIERAVRGCQRGSRTSGVVAVAYADAARVGAVDARSLVSIAADYGARGVLVDTADKAGPGLMALWSTVQLADWVAEVRALGLVAAVAGKLTADAVSAVRFSGADIVGVRGAACVGGRMGRVSEERVRELRYRLRPEDDSLVARNDSPVTTDHDTSDGSAVAKYASTTSAPLAPGGFTSTR